MADLMERLFNCKRFPVCMEVCVKDKEDTFVRYAKMYFCSEDCKEIWKQEHHPKYHPRPDDPFSTWNGA